MRGGEEERRGKKCRVLWYVWDGKRWSVKARVKKDKDEEYYISCMLATKVEICRGHTAEEDKSNSKEEKYFLQRAINKEKRREEKRKEKRARKENIKEYYFILFYISLKNMKVHYLFYVYMYHVMFHH